MKKPDYDQLFAIYYHFSNTFPEIARKSDFADRKFFDTFCRLRLAEKPKICENCKV